MKLIIFTFLILLLLSLTVSAQSESSNAKTYKFDEIIQTSYSEDIKVRLFLLNEELAKTEGGKAYIISYKGLADSKKTFSVEQEKMHRISKFLKLEDSKFVLVSAEFRLKYVVELWIVPKNAAPPKPSKQAEKYDEIGQTVYSEDFKTRLFSIKERFQNEQNHQLCIINYGTIKEKAKRVNQINRALAFADYDNSRVKIIDGGTSKINKTEIWVLDTSSELPVSKSK